MMSDERLHTFMSVLHNRTRYVTVVLEDIFQSHNASAVLRSCDCFGLHDVHVVENRNTFSPNSEIDMGASKWLNVIKHKNITTTIQNLKQQGYRIVATTPHANALSISELDLEKGPVALLFGSEKPGLSTTAFNLADEFVKIEMFGFTESFNISVSAALCMFDIVKRLHNSRINWQLNPAEQEAVLATWMRKSVNDADKIIEYCEKIGQKRQ